MKKILAIDDTVDIQVYLKTILSQDYEVYQAFGGIEGLELWKKHEPDLVILDVMMPDYDGYEVCKMAKKNAKLKSTPVVFLSAKTGVLARVEGYKAGAINYLEKPVEKRELLTVVAALIEQDKGSQVVSFEDIVVDCLAFEVRVLNEVIDLTPNQFRILEFFISNPERLVRRDSLLEYLDIQHKVDSDRSIDGHISNIRHKINKSCLEIVSIYGEGYKIQMKSNA